MPLCTHALATDFQIVVEAFVRGNRVPTISVRSSQKATGHFGIRRSKRLGSNRVRLFMHEQC